MLIGREIAENFGMTEDQAAGGPIVSTDDHPAE